MYGEMLKKYASVSDRAKIFVPSALGKGLKRGGAEQQLSAQVLRTVC